MFREIRGVQQRRTNGARKRWFQDPYFDLFFVEDRNGKVQWFQFCYARDTRRERVLEWRRHLGFQHLRLTDRLDPTRQEGEQLVSDGAMPYLEVAGEFEKSAPGLPPEIASFIGEKLREFAQPQRRFPRRRAAAPRWLGRLRERERAATRQFLEGKEG